MSLIEEMKKDVIEECDNQNEKHFSEEEFEEYLSRVFDTMGETIMEIFNDRKEDD